MCESRGKHQQQYLGISLGLAIGSALGIVFHNPALGISLGVAIGLLLGAARPLRK